MSLSVFAVFAFFYLKETPTWRSAAAFLLVIAAVALVRGDSPKDTGGEAPNPAQAQVIGAAHDQK